MTIKDDLVRLCFLEARKANLNAQIGDLRRDLLKTAMDELDEKDAAPTYRVRSHGTVSLVVPEPKPVIVDEAKLMAWVEREYADEAIETVKRIKPEWLEEFWGFCQKVITGAVIDPSGLTVPGVVVSERPPYLRVVLSKEARAAAEIDAIEETAEVEA